MKAWLRASRWLQKFLAKWRYKLWWLDVLYPFMLSALLFTAFSYLIYHGEKHRRISAQMEETLLGFSLRIASPRPIQVPRRVMTVSLKDHDLKKIGHGTYRGYTDANVDEYAKMLAYLIEKRVSYIVVNWMPSLKEGAGDYSKLLAVLAKASPDQKIIFAVYPLWKSYLPAALSQVANVLESDPCQSSVQLICIYNPQWDDWVIQELSRDLWIEKNTARQRQVVSNNLPRVNPSFLLYVNSLRDFQDYSFTELAEIWFPEGFFDDKLVFVGNALVQRRAGNPEQIGRVATVLTPREGHPRVSGVPYHKFWAQVAQLFIDDDLVAVVPAWVSISLAFVVALLVTISLALLGVPTALGTFLCFATLAPLANALFVRFLRVYIPVFDGLYAGTAAFLIVTFCKLSLESFHSWRLAIQQRAVTDMADSKGNFISLVSHNLNTPVAKMQGVLDVLAQVPLAESVRVDVQRAGGLLARIQLCIRFVLVATAVEDARFNNEAMNLAAIMRTLDEELLHPLGRIGLQLDLKQGPTEPEWALLPIHMDRRVLTATIGALAVLFRQSGGEEELALKLMLSLSEWERRFQKNGVRFVCVLACPSAWISGVIEAHLAGEVRASHREMVGASLLEDVAANLILAVTRAYGGSLRWEKFPGAQGGRIELTLEGVGDERRTNI